MKLYNILVIFIYITLCQSTAYAADQNYQFALVRDIANSYENSLKSEEPATAIDLELAKKQHENYIALVKESVPNIIRLPADEAHPDSNFVEDTAIVIGNKVVISRMGAQERRGEEKPVINTLTNAKSKNLFFMASPATMDGGDILYTGRHLFVGLSARTNIYALQELQKIFHDEVEVISVPVVGVLHLKSVISHLDSETLVVSADAAGNKVKNIIAVSNKSYTFVEVPDPVAANILRIGNKVIMQAGFPASKAILQNICDRKNLQLVEINMSEIIKADGALTCGSILFN
jgi:dimethylargininase